MALVRTAALGVPRAGVTRVGEVAKTRRPLPVSLVIAAARFAEDGVTSQVAMPVPGVIAPKPPTPSLVWISSAAPPGAEPVPADGGVAQVPSPRQNVAVLAPVPLLRWEIAKSPVTPVGSGRPVAFDSVIELGVPSAGVTRVGDVEKTTFPVPVLVVSAVPRFAEVGVASQVEMPAAGTNATNPPEPSLVCRSPDEPAEPSVPDGAAHVPSPRQNVDDDALVPLFRLVTGRFPLTSADSLTIRVLLAPEIVLLVRV